MKRFAACMITALGLLLARPARPQAQTHVRTTPSLLLGAAWYPEQWPKSRWDRDLQLMEDAHLDVVRVGEFAWSSEEPAEGNYDLDWLERAIRLAEKHHIVVVLGTPTDALIDRGGTPVEIALPAEMKDVLAGGVNVSRVRLKPRRVNCV